MPAPVLIINEGFSNFISLIARKKFFRKFLMFLVVGK